MFQHDKGSSRPTPRPDEEKTVDDDMPSHEPGYDQTQPIEVFGKFTMCPEEEQKYLLDLHEDGGICGEELNKLALFFGTQNMDPVFESAATLESMSEALKEESEHYFFDFSILGSGPIPDEATRLGESATH